MGRTRDELERIDEDRPGSWTPEESPVFRGFTQQEAYERLIDGLDAAHWAFKSTDRGKRLLPEASIRESVLPVFDEYLALYQPGEWDSFPADTHRELIEWRKREAMMGYRWEAAKAKWKKRGSWMAFGWLLVLLLSIFFLIELLSAARERERGAEWGARITERMRADQQTELANQVDEYLRERW
ncbi:MAG: hypothetical protein VX641_00785 [Planctomycetota bacterium]|nr:hypothetical protein [Planctomycetota bacterium]